ncbi:hypothetical protein [Amycolatopsis tucumanensis]|uniref:Bulb-type lectin domain-containing protein n=1 Tax=Amycolatopsis tucumanensis TaxID=401106 RepID=A0ABP7HFX2_9PSEU|nr:hypothetical protein [Amycolatopsis tucumanensis]MCF6423780.1 hypothetical protein [Amycolatopsis tucumanensis]
MSHGKRDGMRWWSAVVAGAVFLGGLAASLVGTTVPASADSTPATVAPAGDATILASTVLNGGWRMNSNQSVASPDGRTVLQLLRGLFEVWVDGNHVWTAGQSAAGEYVTFQRDGNLVVYTNAGQAVWAGNTSVWCGTDGCHLSVQDDGNVAIEDDFTQYDVWSTNSARPTAVVSETGQTHVAAW